MLILIIAGGPDKGRIYELFEGRPVVLGREGDQVNLNDRKVSREHARLWCEGGLWYLEDLGSRHGTYRNHAKLDEGQRARLKDGDYIQIGNTVMVMGRMPSEVAERAALLGDNSTSTPRWRKTAPLIAAALTTTAAIVGLGSYLVYELRDLKSQTVSQDQYAQLEQKLLAAQKDSTLAARDLQDAMSQRAAMDRKLTGQQEQLATALQNTGNAIQRHNTAIAEASSDLRNATQPIVEGLAGVQNASKQHELALQRLSDSLADQAQRDNSQQVLAMLGTLKEQLDGQPSSDQLIAKLEQAIAVNAEATGEAVRRAIADTTAGQEQLAAAERTEALVMRVLGELEKLPTAEQIAADIRVAVNDGQLANEEFMRQVLVELRRTGDQISTDVVAAIGEDAGYAQSLMDKVMEELAKQPTGEQLATELRLAMAESMQGQASNQTQVAELMREVLAELEQRPTSEQLAADLRTMIGSDAQRTEQLMAKILTELDSRPTAEQIAAELRSVDNEAAARTASLLERVLARVEDQHALATQIDELRKTIEGQPQTDTQLSRTIMQRLDEQSKNNEQIIAAIAELRQAMPEDVSGKLDQVLAKLDEQVRSEQINAAIETAVARVAASEDKAILAAIDSLSERIAALPSADQLEGVLDSQQQLAALLEDTDTRAAISELRAALDSLAKARPEGQQDQQLTQVIEMLRKREQADLLLAEMHDMLERQPEQAERMKRQVLAAIEEAGQGDTDLLLQQLLDEVRTRLASDEAIRQAIQSEIHGNLLPIQKSIQDAHEVAAEQNNNPATGGESASQPRSSRLTSLEHAYKDAFETGRSVTIGAGTIDPTTGRVSEGRRIDPSVAKALGFDNWRDWYLTDQHAERMRLQQEAQLQRNAADRDKPSDFVTLPGESNEQAE